MINPLSRNTREAPSRRSLKRVPTILGAERTPMLILILISTVLIFSMVTVETTVVGLLIFFIGLRGLQEASRRHPRASQVYLKGLHYRRYYPARRRFPTPMPYRRACKLGAREPRVAPRPAEAESASTVAEGTRRPSGPELAR